MTTSNQSKQHYHPLMMRLHWIMAILLVLAYVFINLKGLFIKGSDPRELMKSLHFMMGLSIFFLVFIRLYAKFTTLKPAIIPAPPKWQAVTSNLIHGLFYALMIAAPILGWLTLSAAGKPIMFFGLELPALINEHQDTAKSLKKLHGKIGSLGYYLIALHTGAGLFHHFGKKDNTLIRMWPFYKKTKCNTST